MMTTLSSVDSESTGNTTVSVDTIQTVDTSLESILVKESEIRETEKQEVVPYVPEGSIALNGVLSGSIISTRSTGSYTYLDSKYTGSLMEGVKKDSNTWISSSNFNVNGNVTGLVSPILIEQVVSGSFDIVADISVNVSSDKVKFSGSGNVALYGNISGSSGNVVEGKDRPFFTVQEFSGSIFTRDTYDSAIFNMNLSDMTVLPLGFVAGGVSLNSASVSSYRVEDSGSVVISESRRIPRQVWIKNTLTVPGIGDICYTDIHAQTRIVSSKIYSVDLDQILYIDSFGVIAAKVGRTDVTETTGSIGSEQSSKALTSLATEIETWGNTEEASTISGESSTSDSTSIIGEETIVGYNFIIS